MTFKTIQIFLRSESSRTMKEKLETFLRYLIIKFYKYLNISNILLMRNDKRIRFKIYPGCSISEKMYILGRYDYNVMHFLLDNIQNKDVFYDIGANVGPFSLLVSKKTTNIFAFEGHPDTTKRLRKNFTLNGISPERAINVVITEKSGNINFLNNKGSAINKVIPFTEKGIKVKTISIDNFSEKNLTPNFVKIDTEGHELKVFKGMKKVLSSGGIDFISFEANGLTSSKNLNNILKLLQSYQFTVGTISYNDKLFICETDLRSRSSSGDYQAISEKMKSRILSKGYLIIY